MRREIQNRLIFQPNPESFCRAIIFSTYPRLLASVVDVGLLNPESGVLAMTFPSNRNQGERRISGPHDL
jgi:hypothetical protein